VYLAGQVPDDPTKDISGQTAEVLANIDANCW
jgi:enamine deaminase RidA (YjgF/YER057c/UK114 family)